MKKPAEGDIFKIITLHGKSFELRYGYYEDYERESKYGEPIPIYPDFLKEPEYTDEGYPFATQMQDVCEHCDGHLSEDACCVDCSHYLNGDDFIGICLSKNRRRVASPIKPDLPPQSNRSEDKL